MEENVIEITFSPAKLFDLYLKGHGISYTHLSKYLDYTPEHVSKICQDKATLTEEARKKLNELLDTDY